MKSAPQAASLEQWLAWLEELHPVTIELGLDRVRAVYKRLALDFGDTRIVIVGGTNGKGSTVAMLDRILRAAGYSTATYTSPHLVRYNERVTLDGREATDAELCAAFASVEAVRQDVSLTYFEYGTLAALMLFARRLPDYLILEVGLGGRLDAVNIVSPDVSIVTNVALDHMDWLGDDREKIGREKAGIYRAGKPAIYGESDMPASVRQAAQAIGARLLHKGEQYLWQADEQRWQWQGQDAAGRALAYEDLPLTLFPLDNAAAVLQALQFLDCKVGVEHIRGGLDKLSVPGRFQELRYRGRRVILDVAHNPHAAAHLAAGMQRLGPPERLHLVIAMLGDKDSATVARTLVPHASHIYVASLQSERGAPGKIIYNHALAAGAVALDAFDTVAEAFETAVGRAAPEDMIVVTGSFYTVTAVLELV